MRTDEFHGFLIDLDHAISSDVIGRHSDVPERTGTLEFMSSHSRGPPELPAYTLRRFAELYVGLFLANRQRPCHDSRPEVLGNRL